MAATQAEPQQNEVNRDLVQQEQPPALGNPGLQNGTDKSANRSLGGSDLAGSKGKISSQISLPVEMSQYRQESGAGPPLHNSDQNANSSDEVAGKINNSDNKSYSHNSEQGGGGDQNYGKGPSDNSNQNIQGYGIPFAQRQGYHHSDPNSPMQIPSENSLHHQSNSYGQYNPQNMRHGYPGSKPMPGPPRPPSGGSVMNSGANFPHGPPQRFMTGQSISQPTGPTPTLNQLLQASNPVHRYQNSYADYNMPKSGEQPQGNMPYNQSWPPPRSMPPYGPQQGSPGFRNPPSSVQQVQGSRGGYGGAPSGGSGGGGGGGGGASPGYPPPASPGGGGSGGGGGPGPQHHYPPYPQRYPTPPSAGSGPQPPPPQQTGPPHPPSQQQQQQPSPQPPMPQSPSQQRQQQQQPPYSPHQMVGSPYGGPPPNAGGSSSGGGPHQSPQHQQPGGPPPPGPTNGPGPGPPPPPGPYGGERWPPPTPSAGPPPSPTQPQPQPSPQPQPPPPSPQQHQSFPSRPQQASTPNAHAPDPGDLHGGNSNDSCSGGVGAAPGTPNSQGGMRPTPSPTGSTGSRSMSPAVGQQNIPMPPRPPSSQSDGGGPARISHSPIAASQGVYQQQLAPPGGHMHNYKMGNVGPVGPGGPGGPGGPMVPQQMPPGSPYSAAAQQQYPPQQGGGQYPGSPRPPPHNQMQYGGPPPPNQSYGAQGGPPGPNNMPGGPGSQYPPSRAILNHVSHSPHSPHSQFGGYQGWGSPGPMNQGPPPGPPMMGPCPGGGNNHVAAGGGGKAGPGPQPTGPSGPSGPPPGPQTPPQPSNASPRSHTPPHYLKQHLQHKVGLSGAGMPPSPGGGYPTNSGPMPPHHHQGGPMGPPPQHPHSHHPGMGPPPPSSMGPPPPNSHHDGPMPPPASTPNSHSTGGPPPPHADMADMHDNGITTTASGTVMTSVSGSQTTGGVTSVVTTGPDGTPMDEASQQSTLSNASAASGGEDATCTPGKSRGSAKDAMLYHPHAPTPHSSAPSPSQPPNTPSSINSLHDDYPPDNSPTWSRTPSSPVFNSHVPQDLYRPKKHDSLGKLYEMDETVERKVWLDKLLQFMEERGTPISACPTISKNPLDLFRLYLYVKERGGFMEVCKVAKNKIWKDIAGLLGIGASSSAAYTLRKHYTKNLLPFECHFDRGGIDPQPIINQVESSTKKKGSKANPVPSPGTSSSNSQDSFPAPGGGPGSGSMDGYNYGYPQDYNNQRPPSQSNQGMLGGYQNQGGYSQYPDQYNQQYPGAPAPGGGSYPPNRPMYPPAPYGAPEAERGYSQGGGSGQGQGQGGQPGSQDPYRGYMGPGNQPGYPPRPGYPPQGPPQGGPPGQSGAGASPGSQGNAPSSQADYYNRGDQVYQGQGGAAGGPPGPGGYPVGTPPSKCMPPPTNQPRRHPDFASKADQQPTGPYPPYNQQRPNMYSGQGGWSSTNNSQYRGPGGQFASQPPSAGGGVGGGWSGGPPRPGPAGPPPPTGQQPPPPPGSQWADQHRYPPNSQPPFQSPQQWASVNNMSNSIGPNASMRPQLGPRSNFRPDGKQFGQMSSGGPGMKGQGVGVQTGAKREMVFPAESVEATTPVLYKRRRLTKSDVAPVDAWRLMMALRSGLLAETCWALDVLNILLFDDNAVAYFGLGHLPGLLDILLEHFRRALADMLESNTTFNDEQPITQPITNEKHYQWYERCVQSSADVDLGQVEKPPDPCERTPLVKCGEHTLRTHRGVPVTVVPASDDIFVLDSKRAWDMDSEFIMPEDGGCDLHDSLSYIVPCFRSDFGLVRFVRVLKTTNNNKNKDKVKDKDKDTVDPLASSAGNSNSCDSRTNNKSNKCDELQNECTLVKVKKEKEDEEPEVEKKVVADSSEMEVDDSSKCENNIKKELKDESETTTEKDPTLSRRIRDPSGTLKQRKVSDYEDECYSRDEASLSTVTESQDAIARRCICLSNILRNLTFVPGNELEFAKNSTFLGLLGKLLLLHHEHPLRTLKQRNYDREEDADFGDCCSSLNGDAEWWWEWLQVLRENALVCVANIAGHIDLEPITEEVSRPLLDGLLHWAVCPAAQGQDPFPSVGPSSPLSPQRLALEALVKLCVTDSNVDLVIATPPFSRLERLCAVLTRLLCRIEEQVLREFAVNLLHYLAAADSGMARTIALQSPCVSLLVAFIEQAEASALGVANQHGINALRDNPDCMGTSLDMLRRAARTLLHLAKHPDNRPLFLQQEQRLLALVMSQILDQQVAALISRVLFHCSRPPATTSSTTTTTTNSTNSSSS